MITRKNFIVRACLAGSIVALGMGAAHAADPVKIGYLIPLSDAAEGACKIGQIMQVCGQEICGGCVLALVL